ncbi:MAG TPA: dephospho-CoA kinase [bacterium]|nr:dephospho-CoA kinase [bacterium]
MRRRQTSEGRRGAAKRAPVIGVTGGYGSGKSYVSGVFRRAGCAVIDADEVAHEAIRPGTVAWRRIVAHFGSQVLGAGRVIDRKKLAALVFGSRHELKYLNGLVHPAVLKEVRVRIARCRREREKVVVLNAPLLIESGAHELCEKVIVLSVTKEVQIRRCERSKHESVAAIRKRIAAQMPLSRKLRYADYVVDNNGTRSQTVKQVQGILRNIREEYNIS